VGPVKTNFQTRTQFWLCWILRPDEKTTAELEAASDFDEAASLTKRAGIGRIRE
jgi:hypothetical protein